MKWKNAALLMGGLVLGIFMGFLVLRVSDGSSGERSTSRNSTPARGLPIADFELNTLTGETVKLSQFRGQPVLINFWGTWCAPCRSEMPLLQAKYEEKSPDLVILAVNVNDTVGMVEDFAEEFGLTFPILLDERGEIRAKYQVRGFPTTYFVDSDGVLRELHIGELDDRLLSEYLVRIGVSP